jgi:hypothetical protein
VAASLVVGNVGIAFFGAGGDGPDTLPPSLYDVSRAFNPLFMALTKDFDKSSQ